MNLPNRNDPFTCKDFAISEFNNYTVHLIPETRKSIPKGV